MAHDPNQLMESAINWHIRLREGGAEDWESFIAWLEEDPARSAAYDAVALADADLSPAFPARANEAANDDFAGDGVASRSWPSRRWVAAGAAAAAIVVGGLSIQRLTAPSSLYQIATLPGQQRHVEIGDGSSVALNGGTRLVLDRENPRFAELAAGEATFTIRHDPRDPFTVVAGQSRVQDLGTRFNLVHDPDRFSVEVIEGSVLYNPDGEAIPLTPGQTLTSTPGDPGLAIGRKAPNLIGGWQQGRLSYASAPLFTVAGDLSRTIGARIEVAPALATRPFTGSIRIGGGPASTLARFSEASALNIRRTNQGWLIEPHQRAPR
ncbi:MAG: anti-FecI sigma factor, FecR [Alphaproteobacteria bacterium]|nr:anti-FecI sigma factor, FecR [Alphaproteobacteria bacterium]